MSPLIALFLACFTFSLAISYVIWRMFRAWDIQARQPALEYQGVSDLFSKFRPSVRDRCRRILMLAAVLCLLAAKATLLL